MAVCSWRCRAGRRNGRAEWAAAGHGLSCANTCTHTCTGTFALWLFPAPSYHSPSSGPSAAPTQPSSNSDLFDDALVR